jgi:hypothetical protein
MAFPEKPSDRRCSDAEVVSRLIDRTDHTMRVERAAEKTDRFIVLKNRCRKAVLRLFRPTFTHDLQTRSINPFRSSRIDRVMGGLTRLDRIPPGSLSFVRPPTLYTGNITVRPDQYRSKLKSVRPAPLGHGSLHSHTMTDISHHSSPFSLPFRDTV